jgi:hypothetical protein
MAGAARQINQQVVSAPIKALAAESAGVVGAGVGRQIGVENEMGPIGQFVTEMAGGMTPAVLPTKLAAAATGKAAGWAFLPFTRQGSYDRASRRIQELVADPIKAARSIEDLKGTNLRPSAASEEPGLMALENAVLAADPAEASRVSIKTSETVNDLVESIRISGKVTDAKEFITAKRNRLFAAIDARIEKASDEAAAALQSVQTDPADGASAAVAVRQSLETALADAKVQEDLLWSAVPKDVKAPISPITKKYQELNASLSQAQIDDMPEVARRILDSAIENNVKTATVQEIDGLYKRLGEVGTQARANKEFNKSRITSGLREAILESIGKAEGNPTTKEALDTARAFSYELNQKFGRGTVGKILGHSREGGSSVPPEQTLNVGVAKPRMSGELALRELKKATDDPNVLDGVQTFLKERFVRAATRNDEVVPAQADAFFRSHAEILEAIPELNQQLRTARNTADVARRIEKSGDSMRRALDRPDVSATARFLNGPVDAEINRVMTSNDPVAVMEQVVRVVKKDTSGKALAGLKAGASDWLIDQVTSPSVTDIAGRPAFNGIKLKYELEKDSVITPLSKVFSPDEIKNLKRSADLLARIERQRKTGETVPIINDRPAWLLDIAGRIVGAKAGAALSQTPGGSIQAASIGSSAVRDFMQRMTANKAKQLIIDALSDPALMQALLEHRPNLKLERAKHEGVIRSWMLAAGSRLLTPEELEKARREEDQRRQVGLRGP